MPTHVPVGSFTPVVVSPHTRGGPPAPPGALDALPDWWGLLHAGTGNPSLPYRDPITNAVATDQLLPVPFGIVRVAGATLAARGSDDNTFAQGVVAWSEGEIESVDAVSWNLHPFASRSDGYVTIVVTNHRGEPGGETNPGNIFGRAQAGFAACAYTYWTVQTVVYYFPWWRYAPGGVQAGPSSGGFDSVAWSADIHGLKLYDPRLDSTNGGAGPQRAADPTTWTFSRCPPLIYRYCLRRYGQLTDAEIDDASFRVMADASDAAGFTCDVVFSTKTLLRDAAAIIFQTCNGKAITTNGKAGIYLDIPNSGAAVASFSEESGDIWDLKYEWVSARDRYTRISVAFANAAANWKPDVTPVKDDPGIATGAIPIKPLVVNAPGISTLAAAVILRDYIFNAGTITYRISGMMNGRGVLLQEGQKVHLETYRDEVDALLIQIPGDQDGFFSFAVKPYEGDTWGTTPVTQGPPITNPPGPNPATAGGDITVTDSSGTRQVAASSGSNVTVYDLFQLIKYTLPSSGTPLKDLRVRGFRGTGAGSKTWDDMVASEIVVPLAGNEPPADGTHFVLSMPGVVKTIRTLTFDSFGRLLSTAEATGPTRIIVRAATATDVLSAGVTVDVAESSSLVTETLPVADTGRGTIIEHPAGVVDGVNPSFTLSKTPSSSVILLIADAMPLNGGVDYTRVGTAITFRAAANKPQTSLVAVYVYGNPDDGGGAVGGEGGPEAPAARWTQLVSGGIGSFAIDPTSPTTLYAGGLTLLKSLDSGGTWTPLTSSAWGTLSVALNCIVVDPVTPSTIYLATNVNGVFKSTDSGATWAAVNSGLPQLLCRSLAMHPTTPSTLFVGLNDDGLYKSVDSGATWTAVSTGGVTYVRCIAFDPVTPSTMYIGTWWSGVYKSTDSGATWAAATTGMGAVSVDCIAIDPATPSTLYAATWGHGVYRSTDSGTTWTAINSGLTDLQTYTVRVDAAHHSTLYLTTNAAGVFKSIDSGATWAALNTGLTDLFVYTVLVNDSTTPSTVYAGTSSAGVFGGTL